MTYHKRSNSSRFRRIRTIPTPRSRRHSLSSNSNPSHRNRKRNRKVRLGRHSPKPIPHQTMPNLRNPLATAIKTPAATLNLRNPVAVATKMRAAIKFKILASPNRTLRVTTPAKPPQGPRQKMPGPRLSHLNNPAPLLPVKPQMRRVAHGQPPRISAAASQMALDMSPASCSGSRGTQAQPYSPASGQALADATNMACKVQNCNANLIKQALGGVCAIEANNGGPASGCDSTVPHPGYDYQGFGQIGTPQTRDAINAMKNAANSPKLTPRRRPTCKESQAPRMRCLRKDKTRTRTRCSVLGS